jgi:GT2 family glycosyltransferase
MPSVGALIVNYNGGAKLLACVDALAAQTVPISSSVVVDNGSTDGSLDDVRLAAPHVHVVALGSNRGLPAARNIGLKALGTDLALSVDGDVYLAPDCTERLIEAHLQHDATVVCPRVMLLPGREQIQCDGGSIYFLGTLTLRHTLHHAPETPAVGAFVGACIGACVLLHRERVLDAGGFDERFFFYFEDLEFCLRLRGRGRRVYCDPTAVAYHDRGRGTPGLSFRGKGAYPVRRAYLTMRHRWLAMLVHYRARTLLVLAPALLAYELASVGLPLLRGWTGAWVRSWLWLIRNGREIRALRRAAQRARTTGDGEILDGGRIPLAPGLVRSPIGRASVTVLSAAFEAYWRLARRVIA